MRNEFTIEEVKPVENKTVQTKEKWYSKFMQIIIPFFIAGFGMVGAGILFSEVQVD
jgi:hypothetical protein